MENQISEAEKIMGSIGLKPAIVIAFDTTASMSAAIENVRANVKTMVESLFEEIPGLKIGIVAHGDYCDHDRCYQQLDLTDNQADIFNFIEQSGATSGGDADECYELVLQKAKELSWPEGGGTFVMIGDAAPHDKLWYDNANMEFIDWEEELKQLKTMGVEVFAVQCLKSDFYPKNNEFWENIGQISETPLLIMESFSDSSATLGAIARASFSAKDEDFESYTKSVVVSCSVNYSDNVSKLSNYRASKSHE